MYIFALNRVISNCFKFLSQENKFIIFTILLLFIYLDLKKILLPFTGLPKGLAVFLMLIDRGQKYT